MIGGQPVQLAFQQLGAGDPLLILHGLLGCGTNWRSAARQIADCRQVFLLDARNHGTSPHHDDMHYPAMVSDVLSFMDRHGIAHADLVGHSMGGKTAMQLALHHPQRVRRLMVVDIAPAQSAGDNAPLIELMQTLPVAGMQRRSELNQALGEHILDASLRAFIAQNAVSRDGRLAWRINLPALVRGLPALMDFPPPGNGRSFQGPTMFVGGERSNYLGDEHADVIQALFPNHRIETVRDAGHWVHAEQPAAFNGLLREFLGCDES